MEHFDAWVQVQQKFPSPNVTAYFRKKLFYMVHINTGTLLLEGEVIYHVYIALHCSQKAASSLTKGPNKGSMQNVICLQKTYIVHPWRPFFFKTIVNGMKTTVSGIISCHCKGWPTFLLVTMVINAKKWVFEYSHKAPQERKEGNTMFNINSTHNCTWQFPGLMWLLQLPMYLSSQTFEIRCFSFCCCLKHFSQTQCYERNTLSKKKCLLRQ